jgi:hypothetical protein
MSDFRFTEFSAFRLRRQTKDVELPAEVGAQKSVEPLVVGPEEILQAVPRGRVQASEPHCMVGVLCPNTNSVCSRSSLRVPPRRGAARLLQERAELAL